jgi:ClpP class serine protease
MSGPMVGVLNSMNTQRNIALNSSFANYMAQAIHKTIGSTDQKTDQEWREEFQKSQTYKAINNTYDQKMDAVKNNRKFTPEEGSVYVNKNNRLVRWVDGDWEPVNAKK